MMSYLFFHFCDQPMSTPFLSMPVDTKHWEMRTQTLFIQSFTCAVWVGDRWSLPFHFPSYQPSANINIMMCIGNMNSQHQSYRRNSLSPAKSKPELISSVPTVTFNLDQQLEIIYVQLSCHLIPNAFFHLCIHCFFSPFNQVDAT